MAGDRDLWRRSVTQPISTGLVAGAPIYPFARMLASSLWFCYVTHVRHPGGLSRPVLQLVQNASNVACLRSNDADDGFIGDPGLCRFDPGTLLCKAGSTQSCLTADQISAVTDIYAGPSDPRTGRQIIPGFPPGAEANWAIFTVPPEPNPGVVAFFKSAVFKNQNWDWKTFDFGADQNESQSVLGAALDANDADLERFRAGGGKLILYQGWGDPIVPPTLVINYYEQVRRTMRIDPGVFMRLFMIPGMSHCSGGCRGPTRLTRWALSTPG